MELCYGLRAQLESKDRLRHPQAAPHPGGWIPETTGPTRFLSNDEDWGRQQGQAVLWAPGPGACLYFHLNLGLQCSRVQLYLRTGPLPTVLVKTEVTSETPGF